MDATTIRRELLRLVEAMEAVQKRQSDVRDELDVLAAQHRLLDAADLLRGK